MTLTRPPTPVLLRTLRDLLDRLVVLLLLPLSLLLQLLPNQMSPPTTPGIVLLPILVPHLPTAPTTTVLSTFPEAWIQICTDDTLVEFSAIDVLHTVESVGAVVVSSVWKPARRLLVPIQPHDDTLDLATFGEQLVDLLLGGVEGQVADI
ncbi:hypothetical protein BC936DRAFT_146473 [Jimgerdemannia flammicorona]|uniref:Uncharacterized protein n=2 Tax=Jimgerdemannia flammicorona TaxID=994334 RepID=A0A433D891_9FUNG|nr:hypothetical protein BC936DRAFT_146473 [Jimgerdemannia flammicorona]RUS31639.1 hypothetical protein BC938DRAFT_477386 [Jimgerdemannia flammicorona]